MYRNFHLPFFKKSDRTESHGTEFENIVCILTGDCWTGQIRQLHGTVLRVDKTELDRT